MVSQLGVIVALVGGKDGQSLHSLCSSLLTRKVISSKAFVKPEKLSPVRHLPFAQDLHSGHDMEEERGSNGCH